MSMKVASSIVSVLFLSLFSTSLAAGSAEDCLGYWETALIDVAPEQFVEYIQDECFAYRELFTFAISGHCTNTNFAYISVGVSNHKGDPVPLVCSIQGMNCTGTSFSYITYLDSPKDYAKVRGEWSKYCNKQIRPGERSYP
jgi:hypothetical protein